MLRNLAHGTLLLVPNKEKVLWTHPDAVVLIACYLQHQTNSSIISSLLLQVESCDDLYALDYPFVDCFVSFSS